MVISTTDPAAALNTTTATTAPPTAPLTGTVATTPPATNQQNVNNNNAPAQTVAPITDPAATLTAPANTGVNAPLITGPNGSVSAAGTLGTMNTNLAQQSLQAQGGQQGYFQPMNMQQMPPNMMYNQNPNMIQSYGVNSINNIANPYPNVNLQQMQQGLLNSPLSAPSNQQMALQGGKLGLQNFMNANRLNNGNNQQMQVPMQQQPMVQPLINANSVPASPGSMYGGINNQQGSIPAGGVTSQTSQITPIQPSLGGWNFLGQSPSTVGVSNPAQNVTQNVNNNNAPAQTVAPLTSAASQLVSDENLKTDIQPAEKSLQDFMSKVKAYNYTYKNPQHNSQSHPEGQVYTSTMAQELEQTELGKQAVINTPEGKKVDYQRLGAISLAINSVLYKEQEKLKKAIAQLKRKK